MDMDFFSMDNEYFLLKERGFSKPRRKNVLGQLLENSEVEYPEYVKVTLRDIRNGLVHRGWRWDAMDKRFMRNNVVIPLLTVAGLIEECEVHVDDIFDGVDEIERKCLRGV